MSTALLRELAEQKLPVTFTESAKVEEIRSLCSTGNVAAMLSPRGSSEPFARVLAITPDGRSLLALDGLRRRKQAQ